MSAYLSINNLTKRYGSTRALEGVGFTIERGDVVALLGPNGAGKSTLFGCLLGLTLPTSGSILLDGAAVTDSDRARFGYLAERIALYPHRSILENASFFAQLKGYSIAEVHEQLERVSLLSLCDRKVRQLSKGLLQRLGLAIALCGRPELIILDEPFNGLDPALLDVLQSILREERQRGATLLISTHTMSAVEPLATHAAILLQGRLAAFDTLSALTAPDGSAGSLEEVYRQIALNHQQPQMAEVFA